MTPGTLPGSGDGVARTSGDADQSDGIGTGAVPAVEHAAGHGNPEPRTRLGRRARWCTVDTGEEVELASRTHRWLSRVIDTMVFVTLMEFLEALFILLSIYNITSFPYSGMYRGVIYGDLIIGAVVLISLIFYEVVWIARQGQNLGKLVFGIKIVRLEDARIPGWRRCVSRALIPAVWLLWLLVPFAGPLLFLLLYAPVMWQSRRQGLHDLFTATIAIKSGVRSGVQLAATGLLLAVAGPVGLQTWAFDHERFTWRNTDALWDIDLVEIAVAFSGELVYYLSSWIGAIVISRMALRRARDAHWSVRALALAALGTTLVTIILFALDWRTVFLA
ncbi:MAG: RDD family protein [bacterium]|nr:RDD family protein [bacterium]